MMNSIVSDRKKLDGGGSVDVSEGSDGGGFPINNVDGIRDSVLDVINLLRVKSQQKETNQDSNHKVKMKKQLKKEDV